MKLPIFQVDAFTHRVFKGTPAAVVHADGGGRSVRSRDARQRLGVV